MHATPSHSSPERFIELDLWRGIAVLAMIIFHFAFDLAFFVNAPLDVYSGFWFWFARVIAGSFIFLAGISIPLALHRKKHVNEQTYLLRRGFLLLGIGMIITLITFILYPAYTIWFGILHAIGAFTLLSIFFRHRPPHAILAGTIILIGGIIFSLGLSPFPAWIGIFPVAFSTFDYFPLFPWLGVFLVGLGISPLIYPGGTARHVITIPSSPLVWFLSWCGKRSLGIYLIHQPLLIGLIFFLK